MKREEIYEYANEVYLVGKISKIIQIPGRRETQFILSVGHGDPKNPIILPDGKYYRDVITVRFFDMDAVYYAEHFKVGNEVKVHAIVQNVTSIKTGTRHVEIWGQAMAKARASRPGHPLVNQNTVHMRGKIDEAKKISNDYILLMIVTDLNCTRPNLRKGSNIPMITDHYHSVTPVGIRCNKNANELLLRFTRYTWIELNGFIYGQTVHDEHVERIIAKSVDIIGQVQKVQ